jgi:hypothetical protein
MRKKVAVVVEKERVVSMRKRETSTSSQDEM